MLVAFTKSLHGQPESGTAEEASTANMEYGGEHISDGNGDVGSVDGDNSQGPNSAWYQLWRAFPPSSSCTPLASSHGAPDGRRGATRVRVAYGGMDNSQRGSDPQVGRACHCLRVAWERHLAQSVVWAMGRKQNDPPR